jgi:hypothetical protein
MRALPGFFVFAAAVPVNLATCSGSPCHRPGAEQAVPDLAAGPAGQASWLRSGLRAACLPSDRDHDDFNPERARYLTALGPAPAEGCVLRVYKANGKLWERSAPVWMSEGEVQADAAFAGRNGGVGVEYRVERAPGARPGVLITGVHPGTPAEGLLEAGDRVLAVDGHEMFDATRWEFADAGTGPVGSVAHVDVEGADGVRRTVEIVRARIE